MSSKSKNLIIVFIVIILLAVVGFAVLTMKPGAIVPAGDGIPLNFKTFNDPQMFSISYPAAATERPTEDASIVFSKNLPFVKGTNLGEKYVQVKISKDLACTIKDQVSMSASTTPVSLNGLSFNKEEGTDVGAGQIYNETSYSLLQGGNCFQLQFVLHSSNIGMYGDTPPPVFDEVLESKVFDDIASTFKITAASGTTVATKTYSNSTYGFAFNYPTSYNMNAGGDSALATFVSVNPTQGASENNHFHVFVLDARNATTFKDYLVKNPILDMNSGDPIAFEKFAPVTISGKTFYYIRAERFEGQFSTKYFYFTPKTVYVFESHAYIGVAWTDPNFDEANETTHKDLKRVISTLTFTK